MSEEHFDITLHVIDWRCNSCGGYCKPTGKIEQQFIGVNVEHLCMKCGTKVMLDTNYPKWDSLINAITKGRPK